MSSQIPDKDLEKRRQGQRVDPLTDVIYTKSEYAPVVPATDGKDKDGEEEEEEEEEEAEEEMIEEEEEVSYDNSEEFHHALQIGCYFRDDHYFLSGAGWVRDYVIFWHEIFFLTFRLCMILVWWVKACEKVCYI